MRTREVEDFLRRSAQDLEDLSVALGRRGDAAFLRLSDPSGEDCWAVVWSPGDRWFSIEIVGGYSLDHFEEETPDDEARHILDEYVGVALAYLRTRPVPTRRGRGRPTLTVQTGSGAVVLRRSLQADLAGLFRRR
ncbi:MAG: hypothetical protein ACTHNI_09025 [Cellulosimicrobium cellulans]